MSTPGDLVRTAIDQALALDDPADRARAISDILGTVKNANAELKTTRRADVLALRATRTLREIAEMLDMTTGRVDQIAKGK